MRVPNRHLQQPGPACQHLAQPLPAALLEEQAFFESERLDVLVAKQRGQQLLNQRLIHMHSLQLHMLLPGTALYRLFSAGHCQLSPGSAFEFSKKGLCKA